MAKKQSIRPGKQDWRGIIDRQEQSGLSASAFCDRESITYSTFLYWRKRLRCSGAVARIEPRFIELTAPSPIVSAESPWLIELDLAPGVQLRIARHV